MANVKIFYVYIYAIPALLSLIIIYNGNYLLGDFRSYFYLMSGLDFAITFVEFLLPLAIIYLMLKLGNRVVLIKSKDARFERFALVLFVFIFFVTLCIGAIKVGNDNNVGGIPGVLMSLVVKLNPYLLIGILAFSKINTRSFVICLLVCVFYSYKQVSLQGYLVVFFSLITFLLSRYRIKPVLFIGLLLIPFFVYEPIFDVLTYIYTIRNQMRGVEFDATQVMALAIGRISSLSSYLYIRDGAYDFSGVSDFFSLGIILERVLGFTLFDTSSPSQIFNMAELGRAGYSIFLGLNGFLYALYQSSVFVFIFNVIIILFVIYVLFQLMPYFDRKNRLLMFFLVMYMPFLSFDIWEISIVFQSLILLNVLYLLYMLGSSALSCVLGKGVNLA